MDVFKELRVRRVAVMQLFRQVKQFASKVYKVEQIRGFGPPPNAVAEDF